MAECVSCGKSIPAGKFFCEECYKSMKGRRATPHKVEPPYAPARREPAGAGKEKSATPPHAPGTVPGAEADKPVPPQSPAEGKEVAKKARADLTPASDKKVVSLKPKVEGVSPGKSIGGKKRFKITITFSERTYNAFARLKGRKKAKAAQAGGEPAETGGMTAKERRARRGGGPHGRPKLKAVSEASEKKAASRNALMRYIGHRERKWDRGDRVAALMATSLVILIIIFCFQGWVRVEWIAGEGTQAVSTTVKGVDLGVLVYVMMALVIAAWAYMAVSSFTGKTLAKLDFGFIIVLCGSIFIILFFVGVGSTERVLGAAAESINKSRNFFETSVSGYERQMLWPAYFTVFLGILYSFSGLARLSERRAGEELREERE